MLIRTHASMNAPEWLAYAISRPSDDRLGRMVQFVSCIIEDAVRELAASLELYWPSEGQNEMPEAHTVGAVGRAFGRAGFHVYHEVQCRTDGALGHVDLLAISQERSACVVVEGKRLYNPDGVAAMLRDWHRLGSTRLASQHGAPSLTDHYRMLVATTWQSEIKERWEGLRDVPTRKDAPSWSDLRKELNAALLTKPSHIIQTDEHWGKQWFLFAFGKKDTSFFAPA